MNGHSNTRGSMGIDLAAAEWRYTAAEPDCYRSPGGGVLIISERSSEIPPFRATSWSSRPKRG